MLKVGLLCVGRLKERFFEDACREYEKRLGPYCRLELTELPEAPLPKKPSEEEIRRALEREGEAILARTPPDGLLVPLCVEGEARSSEELAELFSRWKGEGGRPVFVIGGSHGLHPKVKQAARLRLSLSAMTFPHHLARVMLLEQIYRAFKLEEGASYHK